jgi:hypothetical protein
MKRLLTPLFAVIALTTGVIAWVQYDSAAGLRRQIQSLAAERDTAKADAKRQKTAADLAQENVARLTSERDAAIARAKLLPLPGPPPAPGTVGGPQPTEPSAGSGMMEGIAKMFSTEEGKKMMRSQMAMGLKMQYGTLAKDLKLDPKVADQVMSLLGDRQMALSEATFAAMKGGALDEAAGKEIAAKSQALKKEYDEKLKAVLGESGMTQLTDYERTLGDRMMLNMHEQQFAATGSPLEGTQRDSLLEIMKGERMKTPVSAFDASNAGDTSKSIAAFREEGAIEKWLAQEEAYQQRVLQAATRALNPDQVNALQESFKQQLEMQKFGVKMGKEMFKGSGTPAQVQATTESSAK